MIVYALFLVIMTASGPEDRFLSVFKSETTCEKVAELLKERETPTFDEFEYECRPTPLL